jgi:tRNA threonylcarbamoyladenosine biosynthesis protein TsaE
MRENQSISLKINSSDETNAVAKNIGANLRGGEVVELVGDLGSGKTTFVKGIASGAGSNELVSSPSFTICNEYKASKFKIYHFDFYRLNEPGIIRRELAEVIDAKSNVIVIEWPAVIENILPYERLVIELSATGENSRVIKINYAKALNYLVKGIK